MIRPKMKKSSNKIIVLGLYILAGLSVLAEFIIHRHTYTDIEKIPLFYVLFSAITCTALVFAAKGLRKLISRPESYYLNNYESDTDDSKETMND